MEKINLLNLSRDVFALKTKERILILYDLPEAKKDNFLWKERRKLAKTWFEFFKLKKINVSIASYLATYINNGEFPKNILHNKKEIIIDDLFKKSDVVLALTEFSVTAPLYRYAKKYDLRVASMPGFNEKMIPAINIDYRDVSKKVTKIYSLLLGAESINYTFLVSGKKYVLNIDIRYRRPIKDDGFCRKKKKVINLPGGEAFIPPYEGERGESMTEGYLPIEKDGKVSVYKVKNNHIFSRIGKEDSLIKKIKKDPAVGNIAEAAFGVLALYGIKGCNKILLDEKLGPHIALGRCDHFGGKTGPDSFKQKNNVWHQDFVYTKEMQPSIDLKEVYFTYKKGDKKIIIKNNKYTIFRTS